MMGFLGEYVKAQTSLFNGLAMRGEFHGAIVVAVVVHGKIGLDGASTPHILLWDPVFLHISLPSTYPTPKKLRTPPDQ